VTKKRTKIINTFEGNNPPENFEFPSFGIEDIDRAVFKLFDDKLNFQVEQKGKLSKVPVVFASGERFALTRRKNPIRDKNNALILPLISIMRGEINFSPDQGGKKTAISAREQSTYIVKKRLSKTDRKYQNFINKQGIKHQDNVAARKNFSKTDISPGNIALPGTIASRKNKGNLRYGSGNVNLKPSLNSNIYEIIEIPYPEFITISYDVVFWTQYLTQANEIMESLLVSFEGQGEEITYKTKEGFELVIFFDKNFSNTSNFDGYADEERIVKHSIGLTVPGYIINPKLSGHSNLLRSYFSAPFIDFSYIEPNAKIVNNNQPEREMDKNKKFILSDVTGINDNNLKRGESSEELQTFEINPFTKKLEPVFSKVLTRNKRTGESVISSLITKNIDKQYE